MGKEIQRFGPAARKHRIGKHVVEWKAQPRKHKAGELKGRGGFGVRGGRGVQLVHPRFEAGRGGFGEKVEGKVGGRNGGRAHYSERVSGEALRTARNLGATRGKTGNRRARDCPTPRHQQPLAVTVTGAAAGAAERRSGWHRKNPQRLNEHRTPSSSSAYRKTEEHNELQQMLLLFNHFSLSGQRGCPPRVGGLPARKRCSSGRVRPLNFS